MAKAVVPGVQERLRSIVGIKGWEYVVYWKISDDQRFAEWVGCCCVGTSSQGLHHALESDVFSSAPYFEGSTVRCPDLYVSHAVTKTCLMLSEMPTSVPLDQTGQYNWKTLCRSFGQVLLSGQPLWTHYPVSTDPGLGQDKLQTKVYIPTQNGIIELGISSHVVENAALIQYVKSRCGDTWQEFNVRDVTRTSLQSFHIPLRNDKGLLDTNDLLGGSNVSPLDLSSESALSLGYGRDNMQGYQSSLDQQPFKMFYPSHGAAGGTGELVERNLQLNTASEGNQVQWCSSTDSHPWGVPDGPLSEQFSSQVAHTHLSLFGQEKRVPLTGHHSVQEQYEGSGDSSRLEKNLSAFVQNFHEISVPVVPAQTFHAASESPRGSGLSKENSDRDIKHETRAESSDCSEQIDDEDEKGVPRSGRRHLSKNLVAERKRRKKLNDRLYSLRALVPKITKMDRASILGDAIEYVKELQQQVKDLQDELLETKEDDMQANVATIPEENMNPLLLDEEIGVHVGDDGRGSSKLDPLSTPSLDMGERQIEELRQPMQVEVSKMDAHLFTLRIFCEKRPGVFVKLLQALDTLGLDVLHANITTFRGLVLNVFNAEIRDKELMQAEQVKETLLEMTSQSDCRIANLGNGHVVGPQLISFDS
ncbi:hypothetical protein O6H91_15G025500 [Diphasiastrum complanatum]|uniref:Uncharacterized protein n=1 Tax=Diphasiastrum complanatum TaxID=34168 RepID=A0ACC2BGN7_DIPCM|nr:hypothetical protein O6H91_15G025500 [Diphasiastrum complanatum]